MKKELKYKCSNCGKGSNTQYWNKKTRGWECKDCTPYLNDEKEQK